MPELFDRLFSEAAAARPALAGAIRRLYFREASASAARRGLYTARAVLVDTEPRVVQRCLQGAEDDGGERPVRGWSYHGAGSVYCQGGAANNWACGFNVHGPAVAEQVLATLRREVERCDRLGGLLALHSVAGGTGSGLGSHLLQVTRDAYPAVPLASVSIWPFEGGEVSVQCYNAALSLASLYETVDLAVVCENERYLELCRLSLGEPKPSLASINAAICGNLVRTLLPSLRSSLGVDSCPLLRLSGHLCAHPLYRLATLKALPQVAHGTEAFTSDGWAGLQRRLVQLVESGGTVDRPSAASGASQGPCRVVAASAFLWGQGAAEASLDPLRKLPVWRQALDPLQVHSDPHQVGGLERSIGFVSNCQAVLPTLQTAATRATGMMRASAYMHQYERYGLSRDDMSEALLSLLQVQNDYERL
ncbi:unnamed protein product [Polarella glacialis]|uniref:Tubulin delta chain n=1 Tax=Polarella glacialis TaxID=89957 RepID=A0A813JNP1_POLGL|nr:unnamed protein product [Polarella glacialis]